MLFLRNATGRLRRSFWAVRAFRSLSVSADLLNERYGLKMVCEAESWVQLYPNGAFHWSYLVLWCSIVIRGSLACVLSAGAVLPIGFFHDCLGAGMLAGSWGVYSLLVVSFLLHDDLDLFLICWLCHRTELGTRATSDFFVPLKRKRLTQVAACNCCSLSRPSCAVGTVVGTVPWPAGIPVDSSLATEPGGNLPHPPSVPF